MNKKEVQAEINRRLASGESKSTVFRLMRGNEVSDRRLAYFIASYADPSLCLRYAKLIKAIIAASWVQLAFALLVAVAAGVKMGLIGCLLFVGFIGAFAYLFVWGFTHNKAWAYNATIFMSVINLPKTLGGFSETPGASAVTLLIGVALISFTWYVRSKLFPDFAFISPKKVNGTYAFSS
jgi:hypothetical protein